jgi:hypothetical protein
MDTARRRVEALESAVTALRLLERCEECEERIRGALEPVAACTKIGASVLSYAISNIL